MSLSSTKLLFFAGSAREASFNKRLARLGAQIAEVNGLAATFADLGDYPMPLYDADLQALDGIPENARKLEALINIFLCFQHYSAHQKNLYIQMI